MVAVQMPIYGPALRSLEADPKYAILRDYQAHIAHGYFDQLGIIFFDFERFPPYTEDFHYFFDGVHPGPPLAAAVIEKIGSDPRIHAILPKLDLDNLRRILDQTRTQPDHILLPQ
jgi:hypothetical protein